MVSGYSITTDVSFGKLSESISISNGEEIEKQQANLSRRVVECSNCVFVFLLLYEWKMHCYSPPNQVICHPHSMQDWGVDNTSDFVLKFETTPFMIIKQVLITKHTKVKSNKFIRQNKSTCSHINAILCTHTRVWSIKYWKKERKLNMTQLQFWFSMKTCVCPIEKFEVYA